MSKVMKLINTYLMSIVLILLSIIFIGVTKSTIWIKKNANTAIYLELHESHSFFHVWITQAGT